MKIIQLSDCHLPVPGLGSESREPWQQLEDALSRAAKLAPDAIVVTGDLVDKGAAVQDQAAGLLARAQQDAGCPVITIPGNHDPVGSIDERFNTRRLATGPRPANTVHEACSVRLVGLDTGGFKLPAGQLDEQQLHWLEGLLQVPAPGGTVLLLHHPPVDAPSGLMRGRGLQQPGQLARVLHGSDVRALLCGHYHEAGSAHFAGRPVHLAPALFEGFSVLEINDARLLAHHAAARANA